MGLIYTVLPMDRQCIKWLIRLGIEHSEDQASSRYPTVAEVEDVVSKLSDCKVTIEHDADKRAWRAEIVPTKDKKAEATTVFVRNYVAYDEPCALYFIDGHPKPVFQVIESLSRSCGTYVVVDNAETRPVVVEAGSSPADLAKRYLKLTKN